MAPGRCSTVVLCALLAAADTAGGGLLPVVFHRKTPADSGQGDARSGFACSSLGELTIPCEGHFGYEGEHGPHRWPAKFPECGGRSQSPLDIRMDWTELMHLDKPLKVPVFFWRASQAKLVNIGHTVRLTAVDKSSLQSQTLHGGPLRGQYVLDNIHFHWGKKDAKGSEHAVEGTYYPMEMHMVFNRKSNPRSQSTYRNFGDVAVVAVFLQLSPDDNADLEPLVELLPSLLEVNAGALLGRQFKTAGLLPKQRQLLMYNGSLTTPPCSEIVTWLIFQQPMTVSSRQVAFFRRVKSPFGMLTQNRRPVQALNTRTVYRSIGERLRPEPHSSLSGQRSGLAGASGLYVLCTLLVLHASC